MIAIDSNILVYSVRGYLERLRDVAFRAKVKGAQIHDARVPALCIRHEVTVLWTSDCDFSRFKGLRTVNPLLKHGRE